jgi:bifunctional DNA-binding transcriptional regulator/antitoxin component of YhaV-PrlF toxin-antitoxin module
MCVYTPGAGVKAVTNVMGAKGQVTIAKAIRERLGIGPGWTAVQHVVGEHVELHFVAPDQQTADRSSEAVSPAPAADAWRRTVELRQ